MRWFMVALLVLIGSLTRADILVPIKTIRAQTVLTPDMFTTVPGSNVGAFERADQIVGLESRIVLYTGRPVRLEDVTAPARVKRNQVVQLVFANSGLSIATKGRALDRGAVGDVVRVMNTASRTTLFGTVREDGSVTVSP